MNPIDYGYTPLLIILFFVSLVVSAHSIYRLARENRYLNSLVVEVKLLNEPQQEPEEMTTDEFWDMIEGLHEDQDDKKRGE